MNDTSVEIRKKQLEFWLAKSEEDRLIEGLRMMDEGKFLIQTGILNERPDISEIDLIIETFKRMYRHDFSDAEMQNIFHSFREYHARNKKS